MWEQYRKTVVPMQIFIVLFCLALCYFGHVYWKSGLALFGVMEAFTVIGAAWGVRLRKKIFAANERGRKSKDLVRSRA